MKALFAHELALGPEETIGNRTGLEVKAVSFSDLLAELKVGAYDALFIDLLCPSEFHAEGLTTSTSSNRTMAH